MTAACADGADTTVLVTVAETIPVTVDETIPVTVAIALDDDDQVFRVFALDEQGQPSHTMIVVNAPPPWTGRGELARDFGTVEWVSLSFWAPGALRPIRAGGATTWRTRARRSTNSPQRWLRTQAATPPRRYPSPSAATKVSTSKCHFHRTST